MRAAIYARFSSDKQREASIEDQVRNCERRAHAEKWQVVARFKDEAISGATTDRTGYQAMRRAAAAREFDVLLVEDLSRLSRDQPETERTIRRLEFDGIRVIGLSDGYDSASGKSRKLLRTMRAAINETYLDDLRDKTHRGLEGQARKGNNAGGRTYGYRHVPIEDSTRTDPLGRPVVIAVRREIDSVQAEVVRRIFTLYAEGSSSRSIADRLNRDGVPSPGSSWRRMGARPKHGWSMSAIAGPDATSGILNNELYIGRYIWNRSTWMKDPDTGKRTRRDRPESEWVINALPKLRIVEEELWQRVKARQRERAERIGARVRAGLKLDPRRRGGAPGRYLFSTLLKCAVCGASFVMSSKTHYRCASQVNGRERFCTNTLSVKRSTVERALLDDLKTRLLAPEAIAKVRELVEKGLAEFPKPHADNSARIATLTAEIERLVDAVATGALAPSSAVRERQQRAETELARLEAQAAAPAANVTRMLPRLAADYRALVSDLGNEAVKRNDVHRVRTELRRLLGEEILLRASADGTFLEAAVPAVPERLLLMAVGNGASPAAKNAGCGGRI